MLFASKTETFGSELQVSMCPRLLLWICECITACLDPEWCLSIGPSLHLWFMCIQNSAFSIRNSSLYWSQPSSVVFACKTAPFGSEFQVYMSPRLRLLNCECKTAWLDPEWRLSIGPSLHLWFCAFKTATLASELLVSMGPIPHLWVLHAKQWLQGHNYRSLWVPDNTYGFSLSKQRL